MAKVSMDGLDELVQEVFGEKEGLKTFLEALLERVMEAEVAEHVGAGRHQRSEDRRGHRNGYKPRGLNTRVGKLELSVPQARGCEPYHPSLWARWQRSERACWWPAPRCTSRG